jgi:ARG and Rhodanese-Phosphatase-superfamily-associated Protein domain
MTERNEALGGAALVETLQLGERQAHGPLAVFPLRLRDGGGPGYITLREAIAQRRAVVTEVSQGGSVPELRIVNEGDARILVLDGEELRGAKQNRVLNTSILIGKHSSLVVPVSCTEQGRWSYATREFGESEIVADRQVRYAMKDSINAALASGAGHRSDQGRVWFEVGELHQRHGTTSPTAAMRDAYQTRKADLDVVLAAFPLQDGQQGMLVLHGARVVGLDVVSRAPQYAELHDKLLRSYAFEALVRDGEPGDRAVADAFLERIADLPGRRYKSPGLGWDVRYEGGGVLGSALTYRDHAVHAAFFDVGGVRGASEDGVAGGDPAGTRRPRPDWRIADARERARRRQAR